MSTWKHFFAFLPLGLAACGGAVPTPRLANEAEPSSSPLGASYVLIPLPTEDDALLGRILEALPEPGRSLEETARPNPCAEKLTPPKTTPLQATFEDAQEMSAGGQARAMLGVFGFEGDAKAASHFIYKMTTERRMAQTDTTEYVACCKEKGCGIGFVSALIHGDGEYATGEEASASGGVNFVAAGASGSVNLRVLHRRKVHGWMAALVTVTDSAKAASLGPLGVTAESGVTETTVPEQVKEIYDNNTIRINGAGRGYTFQLGSGETITENEFVDRFRVTTGSNAIDDVRRRRNTPTVIFAATGVAVGLGAVTWGLMNLKKKCGSDDAEETLTNSGWVTTGDCAVTGSTTRTGSAFYGSPYDQDAETFNKAGAIVAGLGGVVVVGFGTWLVMSLLQPNGGPESHYLTDSDARIYATRYNRALLRRTIRDVKRSNASTTNFPSLGFDATGIRGTF